MTEIRFKREFTVAWVIAHTWGASMDLFFGVHPNHWLWLVWGLTVLVIELAAVRRKRPGDTWSEHFWLWSGNKIGRRIQTATYGLWFSWHVYGITPGGPLPPEPWATGVGALLITLTLAVWVFIHFLFEGEHG